MSRYVIMQTIGVVITFTCFMVAAWLCGTITGLIVTGLSGMFFAYIAREVQLDMEREAAMACIVLDEQMRRCVLDR